jgi:hypothetical protein
MTGRMILCRCGAMITTRSGSTPRRHRPRSAATPPSRRRSPTHRRTLPTATTPPSPRPAAGLDPAPHQLISGRRSQRPHHEPPYLGQRAGWANGTILYGACPRTGSGGHLSARRGYGPVPWTPAFAGAGFGEADQAQPNLVVLVSAWCGVSPSSQLLPGSRDLQHGTVRHDAVPGVAPRRQP